MKSLRFFLFLTLTMSAHAYEAQVRKGELPAKLSSLLEKATQDTGVNFDHFTFLLIENRDLATSNFQMYVQTNSGVPVAKTAVRIWTDKNSGELILGEMHLDEAAVKNSEALKAKYSKAKFSPSALKSKQLALAINKIVGKEVRGHSTDRQILGLKARDQWLNGDLVRTVEIRGRRGVHLITISLLKNVVVKKTYFEFPQSESMHSLHAHVYPIYEEVEGTGEKLPYEVRELKYLSSDVQEAGDAPLGPLAEKVFPELLYNAIKADTKVGEEQGYWSEASIRRQVQALVGKLPKRPNAFESGLLLQGKYVTINLHPAAKEAFKDINFELRPSVNHIISWGEGENGTQAKAVAGFFGKPIMSADEVLARIPERRADHDPASYINAGFDEVQVYYSVTVFMEALAEMGLTDAQISTDPFHAFLYDPDIGMKDNAYYWDNTINFTTYSPESLNYARDNTTIWHELGHGIMDRLMGPHLSFDGAGGYGGLSEGMADFLAELIVEDQTNGADFAGKNGMRIINQTGFYLTNEYHDEGEAYGGVMRDMLQQAIGRYGKVGLSAFSELTLEAMRLTRNHPALSARSWFEHMLYADELGSPTRSPGFFKDLMIKALSARNFAFAKEFKPAAMTVSFEDTELTSESKASREKPLTPCDLSGSVTYDLKVKLSPGDSEFIKFPAIVKVEYKKGALQGAVKWDGESQNPEEYVVNSAADELSIPLKASMGCDFVNQPDGSCKDYAYLQVWNQGETKPRAKKRFYVKIKDKDACSK